jgi:ribonuclease Z
MLDISLLGTGGMIPLHNRYLTALLARYNGRMLLIDCGEGTQVTMRELGWGFIKLDVILFTHFHADHISGLPGLLLSLSNYGRTKPITVVGPNGIEEVVNSLRVIAPELQYSIQFMELSFDGNSPVCFELGDFHISALPLAHGQTCVGYSINIPRGGKFDPQRATAQNIPVQYWSRLQNGETVAGYTPEMVLGGPRKGIKASYITDTRPINTIPDFIDGSDLFICEGIYGDEKMKQKACRYYHMIFSDAAKLAKAGKVRELWLTHYSQAFSDPENYISEAREIFENTVAGFDRLTKSLEFVD